MSREKAEEIVLACQRMVVEAESTIKFANEFQRALLERLNEVGLPQDFDVAEFIQFAHVEIIGKLRRLNDGLRDYRDIEQKNPLIQ